MEFLSLSHRRSSARNVPSGEERAETDGYCSFYFCHICCSIFSHNKKNSCYFCDFCEICGLLEVLLDLFSLLVQNLLNLLFLLFLPYLLLNLFTQQQKFLLLLRFLRNLLFLLYFFDFCEICYFFFTFLIVVFFKYFLLKLRKQFASKFLSTRSILDVSDAKGNLYVFVLAAPACSKRSVGEEGIKKSNGVAEGERVKFPYNQTRLTIALSKQPM